MFSSFQAAALMLSLLAGPVVRSSFAGAWSGIRVPRISGGGSGCRARDVLEQITRRLVASRVAHAMSLLVLEAVEGGSIVSAVALARHRSAHGVLASSVGAEQFPWLWRTAEQCQRHCVESQVGCHSWLDRLADHFVVGQIDHYRQTQPVLGGGDVGDVTRPLAIRSGGEVAIGHVPCPRRIVLGVRCRLVTPLVPRPDAVLAHQVFKARQTDLVATPTQLGVNASCVCQTS